MAGWPNLPESPRGWLRNGANGKAQDGTATQALRRMAEAEPELAARLVLQSLPAAAATLPAGLSYRLELEGLGAWRVNPLGDRAEVTEVRRGRRPERRGLRDLDRPRDAGPARLGAQPDRRAGARPAASSAASAARRWRCAGSPRTPARATWRGSACRSTPTWSSARSPTRSSRSGPAATASRRLRAGRRGRRRLARRRRRRRRPRRARPRRGPRRDRPDPLRRLAAPAVRRDHPVRRDEARPDRGRGQDLPRSPGWAAGSTGPRASTARSSSARCASAACRRRTPAAGAAR